MCGFAGFIDFRRSRGDAELSALATRMAGQIGYRGPDDAHVWSDATRGIAMAFRRLAIIDPGLRGRQPMLSQSGRLVLSFNGEIYNAPRLRLELEKAGRRFSGHSDTGVLVEALDHWGVPRTLQRLSGMFAFACWNRDTGELVLARDHIGKKPLYHGRIAGTFFFGSQPRAFTPHPDWNADIDRNSLGAFLRFGYVPAPRSIFKGIDKLRPGTWATLDAAGTLKTCRYWDLQHIAGRARRSAVRIGDRAATDRLDALLGAAVERRLLSDVPVGALLSGGIDSSAVVALLRQRCAGPVKTFSIGFAEAQYDESGHARRVAAHLGTEHHELRVSPAQLLATVPTIPDFYDEPFADASQVPTLLLSRLAREHVTVALSGDGGDELFAGYTRYRHAMTVLAHIARLPPAIRPGLAAILNAVPGRVWRALHPLMPRRFGQSSLSTRMARMADMLSADGIEQIHRHLVGCWPQPDRLVMNGQAPEDPVWRGNTADHLSDPLRRMQLIDSLTWLPDDILTKIDRASMAVALEVRSPLLDREIVEFSWSLPTDMLVRDRHPKWILRQVLAKYVPASLTDRPKAGFVFPVAEWLRGPLRDWAADLLSPARLAADGYLHPGDITTCWQQHLTGNADWSQRLWCILMFQTWQARVRCPD